MRKRLLIAVGLFAMMFAAFATLAHTAPPEPKIPKWFTLSISEDAGGLWVQRDGGKPIGALYASRIGGQDNAVLGFYRNGSRADAHDFAIVTDADGVRFQFRDEAGKIRTLPASALAKLLDEPKPVQAANPVEGKRLSFKGLRGRIHAELERRAALPATDPDHVSADSHGKAKELVGQLGDGHLLELLIKYGPAIIKIVEALLGMLAFL